MTTIRSGASANGSKELSRGDAFRLSPKQWGKQQQPGLVHRRIRKHGNLRAQFSGMLGHEPELSNGWARHVFVDPYRRKSGMSLTLGATDPGRQECAASGARFRKDAETGEGREVRPMVSAMTSPAQPCTSIRRHGNRVQTDTDICRRTPVLSAHHLFLSLARYRGNMPCVPSTASVQRGRGREIFAVSSVISPRSFRSQRGSRLCPESKCRGYSSARSLGSDY